LHLYKLEQDGDIIPVPTSVKELHPEEGAVVAMVEVSMPAGSRQNK